MTQILKQLEGAVAARSISDCGQRVPTVIRSTAWLGGTTLAVNPRINCHKR